MVQKAQIGKLGWTELFKLSGIWERSIGDWPSIDFWNIYHVTFIRNSNKIRISGVAWNEFQARSTVGRLRFATKFDMKLEMAISNFDRNFPSSFFLFFPADELSKQSDAAQFKDVVRNFAIVSCHFYPACLNFQKSGLKLTSPHDEKFVNNIFFKNDSK